MSLATVYADGIEGSLQRWAGNPGPAPEPGFTGTAILGALPTAAREAAASFTELMAGMEERSLATLEKQARADQERGLPGKPAEVLERKREAARVLREQAVATRRGAIESMPDPLTTHTADQVIHGLGRFAGKAVAAVGTLGPAGAILLGVEEGNTAAQTLMTEGVDPATAAKVGAVQGGVAAASVVLPIAGATIPQTIGLVGAGGPGAFMVQESLSRKILQEAGYANQASLHNPFDPLGLTLSAVVPGAFGALHMRTQRRPALERIVEHIESGGQRYGKDGKLLTSPKGAQGEMQVMPGTAKDPGFGVAPARDNSPEELARVGRDYLAAMQQRYGGDTDKALAAYNAGPGAVDAAVKEHGGQWLKAMPKETQEYVYKANALGARHAAQVAAQDPAAVDAARVAVLNDSLSRNLPDIPDAVAHVQRAADAVGEGRVPEVPPAIPRAAALMPADRAIESRMVERVADLERAMSDYAALPDSMGGKLLNTDVVRELSPDYLADRTRAAAVHEPASWFTKQMYEQRLSELQPGERVVFTSGGTGAGKTTAINGVAAARRLQEDAAIIYDTNMNSLDTAVARVDKALAAGAEVHIVHVQRDPMDALVNGALRRAMRQEKEFGSGRTVPLPDFAKAHAGSSRVIQQLAARYADNPNFALHVIDNTHGPGGARMAELDFVTKFDYTGIEERLYAAVQAEHQAGRISDAVFRATAEPQGMGQAAGAGDGAGLAPSVRAAQAAEELAAARRNAEAPNALPDPGRLDSTPTKTDGATPAADAAVLRDQELVQRLADDAPDLQVVLPGLDERITIKDALARIAEERKLEEQWADLLKVAVDCALTAG